MNRAEMNDTITAYRNGFDDGFHVGQMSERNDIDTSHPAYKAGYEHGVSLYCEVALEIA